MIIAVDFDGTVVDHGYPEIGEPLPLAFEALRALKARGHLLVLFTCREDGPLRNYLQEAVDFCRARGLEWDGVNETPPYSDFRPDGVLRRKVYADVYIDDRANFAGRIDWFEVVKWFNLSERELVGAAA